MKHKEEDVGKLLEERQQLEDWLERLELSSEEVPDAVRTKVRDDYRGRLDTVLEGLSKFRDELQASLKEEIQRREDLWTAEREVKEKLAEAQLRHEVGEFDDKAWQETQAESNEELERISEDLDAATAEVQRLENVLSAMSTKQEKAATDEAPSESEANGDQKPKDQTDAFAEMQLIKSSSKVSGEQPPEEEVEEKPADEPKIDAQVSRPSTIGQQGLPVGKKTLKCSECGKLNLPTEWYCEHCGAELASL